MRILHTADWHLGRTLEGRSRLEEQAAVLDELADIARDLRIDLVLMAGDLYDSVNPPAAAEQLFYESAARLTDNGSRQLICIAGNHDHPDRVAASSPLAVRHGIHLVGLPTDGVVETVCPRTGERAVVAAMAYPSESRLNELLSAQADEELLRSAYSDRVGRLLRQMAARFRPDAVNLVMSHLYVTGGAESGSERPIQVGGAYTVDADAFGVPAQYVALGHLHRAQNIRGPVPIRYSGSPLAYSFSEEGQVKSVSVLELRPGADDVSTIVEEIPLASGRPLVKWEATEGIEQVYRWLEEGRDPDAWIELEIRMTESLTHEQIHRLRTLRPGFVQIRPVYPEIEEIQERRLPTRLPMDELFRQFYRRQTGGAEPEAELVRLFLELIEESAATETAE